MRSSCRTLDGVPTQFRKRQPSAQTGLPAHDPEPIISELPLAELKAIAEGLTATQAIEPAKPLSANPEPLAKADELKQPLEAGAEGLTATQAIEPAKPLFADGEPVADAAEIPRHLPLAIHAPRQNSPSMADFFLMAITMLIMVDGENFLFGK